MDNALSAAPPNALATEGGHVLVVEDDAATLALLRECLCEAGFLVSTVATIEAAVAAVVAQRFNLVLSDAFRAFGALERDPWSALTLLHAAASGAPCVILSANGARS